MPENLLIHEKSPYLLQHAHNPVNWFPWGEKAFAAARSTDRPIFLSIGYSTCHWCHVMERESFEDNEVASLLNSAFIAVKVDREERPDVDAVYMAACQALNGSGGWPLTILMTPTQKPFWSGTYLPKHDRFGQMGLITLLEQVASLWQKDRTQLLQSGDAITAHIAVQGPSASAQPSKTLFREAALFFQQSFDEKNGGFGSAPKFPIPHNLLFLLNYARLENDREAQRMAEVTLTQMARGGLFDQIGGGFSRYSTDAKWLVPHFEKMLYDNALLAYTYLEAFLHTGKAFYRTVATQTLDYILRELTGPNGEFYCGQDADSDGEEGKFYLLTPDAVTEALGPEDGLRFCRWYGISGQKGLDGRSIPNLLKNQDFAQTSPELTAMREKLRAYRNGRAKLHLDDKVLTAWNALGIAAFAKAYRVLGEPRYLDAASRAAKFLQNQLTAPDGRLWLRWREGESAQAAQLDDYAFYAWALLELYSADYDPVHLKAAAHLAAELETRFCDKVHGGFFLTAEDGEPLIIRPKEVYDGALPSGNAVGGLVLTRLWKLTGDTKWRTYADTQLAFLSACAGDHPSAHSFALLALMEDLYPSQELVCVTAADRLPQGLHALAERHHLHTLVKTRENDKRLAELAPFTTAYPFPSAGTLFYLCRNGACSTPVADLNALENLL